MHPIIQQNLESLYELLMHNVPVGLMIQDRDLRVIGCNDAAIELLGIRPEDMGLASPELLPDVLAADGSVVRDEDRPARIAVRERRNVHGIVLDIRRPVDGTRVWISTDVSIRLDASGEVDFVLGSLTDLTAVRVREDEIRLLSMVAENTDNAVVLADRERKVKWVNRAFEDMTGWALEDVRGNSPGEVLQGEDTEPAVVQRMHDRLEAGEGFREELLNYHRDGRPMWIDLEVRPLHDEAGRIEQWMAIKRDVTRRREYENSLVRLEAESRARAMELEAALERSQVLAVEAQRADRAKATFLRNMNHEVRTPLNGLLGGCSLLEETELDGNQVELLQIVTESAERLARTLGLALELASQESLHGALREQPFALVDVLTPLVLNYTPKVEERGLELRVCTPERTDVELLGDAPRLRQVLVQLLDNAIAFTPAGWVELGAVTSIDGSTCHLRFWVEDTGCGVLPQDRERIFDAFEQVDSSTTRPHEGAGLGLSLARQLVQRMGGRIRIVEAARGGARLEVDLGLPICDTSRMALEV